MASRKTNRRSARGEEGGSAGGEAPGDGSLIRLQKVLASAGLGSRRACERIIEEGRVEVDGELVTRLGTVVDPEVQRVSVDRRPLRLEPKIYRILYKPRKVVTTLSDPEGRPTISDYLHETARLFPVGRLDFMSEGLVFLTNDGDLAQRLMHPRYGVVREYLVTVSGHVSEEALDQVRAGVRLSEGRTAPAEVSTGRLGQRGSLLTIRLREGKNREVRRILAKVGLKVRRLIRTRIGPVYLGELKPGESRRLSQSEMAKLRQATSGRRRPRRPAARKTE